MRKVSSSEYVLKTLLSHDILQDGTILICDDWMCSFGQQKALSEIMKEYPDWHFEKYCNYGIGSQAFIVHDRRVTVGKKMSMSAL